MAEEHNQKTDPLMELFQQKDDTTNQQGDNAPNEAPQTKRGSSLIVNKIREELLQQEITEAEYNQKADPEAEYIAKERQYVDQYQEEKTATFYYRVPPATPEELLLLIADKTRKAQEETAKNTRTIKNIIVALLILSIIAGIIIAIAEVTGGHNTPTYYPYY